MSLNWSSLSTGARAVGVLRSEYQKLESSSPGISKTSENASPSEKSKTSVRSSSSLESLETEETKKLSTAELQRLVLLEELQFIRLKKAKLLCESPKETSVEMIDGKSFRVL